MGEKRREFALQPRPIQQSELYRNIVKPARCEAAIEMPQSRNDYPDDGHFDVGPGLIEDEEIEARASSDIDAGDDLIAGVVERAELHVGARLGRWIAARRQKGMVLQTQWIGAVETRFLAGSAAHQTDRQKLVQLSQCTQHGNALIEVSAGAELDIFLTVLHPVRYRHIGRNAKIAGDVEHPKPAPGVGQLGLQVADVGVVELAEVHFSPLQSIVPPDRVGIPYHHFEESLDNGLLQRVARCAAVGIRVEGGGATTVEKI